jgi:hypothetical protein
MFDLFVCYRLNKSQVLCDISPTRLCNINTVRRSYRIHFVLNDGFIKASLMNIFSLTFFIEECEDYNVAMKVKRQFLKFDLRLQQIRNLF